MRWLLLEEYGSTFHMSIHMSLFPTLHSVEMMLRESKATRAKDWSMERHNLLHVAWVGEIVYELGLSTWGRNHYTSHISCREEALGQQMVATWGLIDEERHIATQLEAIIDILERQLWNWAYITHWRRWGNIPYEDATWEGDGFLQHPLLQLLEDKQRFGGEDCNIPNFPSANWNIRVLTFLI